MKRQKTSVISVLSLHHTIVWANVDYLGTGLNLKDLIWKASFFTKSFIAIPGKEAYIYKMKFYADKGTKGAISTKQCQT